MNECAKPHIEYEKTSAFENQFCDEIYSFNQ